MRSSFALLALLALPLAACDSTSTPAPKACSLNASAPAIDRSMIYTYTVSGTGTVSNVSYRSAAPVAGNSGITEIKTAVALPWSQQVTLAAGAAPLLSATGVVREGTLTAKIEGRAVGSTTVTVNASDACSQSVN